MTATKSCMSRSVAECRHIPECLDLEQPDPFADPILSRTPAFLNPAGPAGATLAMGSRIGG